jgi:hypothetical protein
MLWILGGSLISATLDRIPDPLAANPNYSQCSASFVSDRCVATIGAVAFVGAPLHFTARIAGRDAAELFPYNGLTVRLEQAADPSPPAL